MKIHTLASPFSSRGPRCILDIIIEKDGYSYSIVNMRNPDVINNDNLILKLESKALTISGSYSRDGKTFTKIGIIDMIRDDLKAVIAIRKGLLQPGRTDGSTGYP